MTSFDLKVVTMSGLKFDGKVTKVLVRTVSGDICILGSHTDYAAPLGEGNAKIVLENGETVNAHLKGGFISVQGKNTRIVATEFDIT